MKAGFSIKLILYFAPNCPQQIVAPNCPTPNCKRRIVSAELSCAELSGHRPWGPINRFPRTENTGRTDPQRTKQIDPPSGKQIRGGSKFTIIKYYYNILL